MIKMPCPYCGIRLTVPDAKFGKSGRCSACQERFVVPHPTRANRRSGQAVRDEDDSALVIEPDEDDSSRVIEPDGDTALEIVDFPDSPSVRNSKDDRFLTEVIAESPDVPRAVLHRISAAVAAHHAAVEEDVFREADICISVLEYDPGSRFLRYMLPFFAGAARVKISVSGTVNGNTISFSAHPDISAARYIGAFGGSSEAMLEACLQDCIGSLYSVIDTAAGRETPPFARFWAHVRRVRWIVAAVVCVAYPSLFLALHQAKPDGNNGGAMFVMIFGTVIVSASTFGFISVVGLIVASSDFLLNHPDGMKAMTRAGVKSPLALRIVAAVPGLISLGGIALALLCLTDAH